MNGDSWQPCTTPAKTPAEVAWPAEWQRIRQAIIGALAPFPEARAAVAEAIRPEVKRDEDRSV